MFRSDISIAVDQGLLARTPRRLRRVIGRLSVRIAARTGEDPRELAALLRGFFQPSLPYDRGHGTGEED
jgi:hypothetical protein